MKNYCKVCNKETEFKELDSGNFLCTRCFYITDLKDEEVEDENN